MTLTFTFLDFELFLEINNVILFCILTYSRGIQVALIIFFFIFFFYSTPKFLRGKLAACLSVVNFGVNKRIQTLLIPAWKALSDIPTVSLVLHVSKQMVCHCALFVFIVSFVHFHSFGHFCV